MNEPVREVKINVYLTTKQYNRLCRYMKFRECYSTSVEMATRFAQAGPVEAIKRGAIEED